TKTIFDCGMPLGTAAGVALSSTSSDRPRWRGAFRTGPFQHALICSAIMYPQGNGFDADAYAKLEIYSDATESTLVSTTEFHYGTNPLQSANVTGWQHLKEVVKYV